MCNNDLFKKFSIFVFVFVSETGSYFVARADLEFTI
jgi:hypothetical protein